MFLQEWDKMPEFMKNDELRTYYDKLSKHKSSLIVKRLLDIVGSVCGIIVFSPIMLVVAIAIKIDSPGNVFFRQERITTYGRKFRIWKFRSMVCDAEQRGTQVTTKADERVTKVGKFIRKYRLDEVPQLFNILVGDMTLVGVRPEVEKYVNYYTPEMCATFLLPAGVTSEASIRYKDENTLLTSELDTDSAYIQQILPEKMFYTLKAIREFSITNDLKTIFRTVLAVCGKEYVDLREDTIWEESTSVTSQKN